MEAAFASRVQAQLGVLDATPITIRTPQEFVASNAPANHITVMVYQDCVPYLQNRIAAGTAPGAALQAWLTRVDVFLNALRDRRTSVFPVALNLALEETDTLRATLITTYGCVFRNDAPPPVPAASAPDPAVRFFAMDVFAKSAVARKLQAELNASARAADHRPATKAPDIDTVYHALATARKTQTGMAQDLQQLTDLVKVREGEAKNARTRSAELEEQIAALTVEHAGVRAALHKDIQWTRTELRALMEQVDGLTTERAHLLGEVTRLQRDVEARDAHIEAIRVSTSWRLTGPLRRFRQLFRR
ncbi:hypothetical protein [Roseovarius gaetbuli]|nr:hypothetical protein [Roseovarius gaetbuli]